MATMQDVVATLAARHPGLRNAENLAPQFLRGLHSSLGIRFGPTTHQDLTVTSLRRTPAGVYRVLATHPGKPGKVLEAEIVVETHATVPPSWGTTRPKIWDQTANVAGIAKRWPGTEIEIVAGGVK